jgi:hypothetical protein
MPITMPARNKRKAAVRIALAALLLPFSGCDSRSETPRADQRVQSAELTNSPLRVWTLLPIASGCSARQTTLSA